MVLNRWLMRMTALYYCCFHWLYSRGTLLSAQWWPKWEGNPKKIKCMYMYSWFALRREEINTTLQSNYTPIKKFSDSRVDEEKRAQKVGASHEVAQWDNCRWGVYVSLQLHVVHFQPTVRWTSIFFLKSKRVLLNTVHIITMFNSESTCNVLSNLNNWR